MHRRQGNQPKNALWAAESVQVPYHLQNTRPQQKKADDTYENNCALGTTLQPQIMASTLDIYCRACLS